MDGDGAGAPTDERDVATALVQEFVDRIPRRVIERIAREELGLFSRTKDRSRVPVVAWRLARGRLEETLPNLATGDTQIAS
jgi:hypothetical protein